MENVALRVKNTRRKKKEKLYIFLIIHFGRCSFFVVVFPGRLPGQCASRGSGGVLFFYRGRYNGFWTGSAEAPHSGHGGGLHGRHSGGDSGEAVVCFCLHQDV